MELVSNQKLNLHYTHAEPASEQSNSRGQALIREGQSLKLSTKAAVFKRVSLLIGGGKHVNWGGAASPRPPVGPALYSRYYAEA